MPPVRLFIIPRGRRTPTISDSPIGVLPARPADNANVLASLLSQSEAWPPDVLPGLRQRMLRTEKAELAWPDRFSTR
jgi:hypothetical protein